MECLQHPPLATASLVSALAACFLFRRAAARALKPWRRMKSHKPCAHQHDTGWWWMMYSSIMSKHVSQTFDSILESVIKGQVSTTQPPKASATTIPLPKSPNMLNMAIKCYTESTKFNFGKWTSRCFLLKLGESFSAIVSSPGYWTKSWSVHNSMSWVLLFARHKQYTTPLQSYYDFQSANIN